MKRILAVVLASAAWSAHAGDAATDAAVSGRISQIRAMPPAANAAAAGAQRRELDAAWRFFGDYRDNALPLLRRELVAELRASRPSQPLLLDAACFLVAYGAEADKPLAVQAALAINPDAALDGPQLFRLMHAAAASQDARLLPLIDRIFLRKSVTIPLPQQGSMIDETGVRALLYGRFGAAGERHLVAQLRDPALVKPVLDVLQIVGSPASVPAVEPLLQSADMETFTRAVNFLVRSGGPQGRQALLALKPQGLSKEAVAFFAPMRQQLAQQPAPQAGKGALADAEVRRLLDALETSGGRYQGIDPSAIVQSRLPKQELLERLTRIRERSFGRATNEALADIDTTSALLNAISYRHQ
ncbi:hypothetical protein SAMN05518865_10414 [Duganella sp. CF458]|uniref:hypothetical protein n=1 Tax=Duganella sp. CF458 TaxID=1884368 RepID=UPI0008E84206|nr:hypothetical protein [Duganella sp. CF458]SFF73535.1 hypothetical protein SAMN05518865_10414 [Duganella sp. CF458]